ncbi:NAD(P)/FAD-dependent oxidoreductase [Clostridium felsineum]|uniref:Ferredoxin--NADP reductase n=1 Tax=Clostridium felsineum TaxID=36839 RepID=A0A1S8LP23_9CLOT|nr:FAD-dependent oxidoreductase [Clostridium felsineum]URZ01451.1 Ferredoxin--NADP reductase [Clostridium felsineum]URZ05705.1 Ferredoxin--NADP reductase [Clostridium felsineum]URZ10744.1 Ferredoxin--NADP reductase [Clostridium felsineum]
MEYDLVIIGGGLSGIRTAISARKEGVKNILLIEAEDTLGGILNQCIHNGFGERIFNEELTGTEYIQRFIDEFLRLNINYKLNSTVIKLSKNKTVTFVNSEDGVVEIKACSIVCACGAIEKPKKSIRLLTRDLSGIYYAAAAERLINIHGYMPGKSIVILGANEIGNLLANRIYIEGGKVKAVIDNGVSLNKKNEIIELLAKINVPLLYDYDIMKIKGRGRIEGIYISNRNFEEKFISCDTLIFAQKLSCNDKLLKDSNIKSLNKEEKESKTNTSGIFIVGDTLYIHEFNSNDIVFESERLGKVITEYIEECTDK